MLELSFLLGVRPGQKPPWFCLTLAMQKLHISTVESLFKINSFLAESPVMQCILSNSSFGLFFSNFWDVLDNKKNSNSQSKFLRHSLLWHEWAELWDPGLCFWAAGSEISWVCCCTMVLFLTSSSSRSHPALRTYHISLGAHSHLLQLLSRGGLNIKGRPKFETHLTLIRETDVINYSISSGIRRQLTRFPSKIIINDLKFKSLKCHLWKITFKHS